MVDVDFPTVALSRAEFTLGVLQLRVAPRHDVPGSWTSFRVVGADPAIWDARGPVETVIDPDPGGITVRTRPVPADLTLTPR